MCASFQDFGVVDYPKGVLRAVSKLTDSRNRNKKLLIHIRDEEFSFDMLRTGLRGTTRIVERDHGLALPLMRYNGQTRG